VDEEVVVEGERARLFAHHAHRARICHGPRTMPSQGTIKRRRLVALLVAVTVASAVVVALLAQGGGEKGPRRVVPGAGSGGETRDPLAYTDDRRADFEARAAQGLAHPLYDKSPGGVVRTAERVARLRPLVEGAAGDKVDPDVLEAIVFLESAGRPDAVASSDLAGAVGLTQILAETGSGLLGMHVDLAASRRITRRLSHTLDPERRKRLFLRRRRVDQRFDPRAAVAATVRYLEFAKGKLSGRDDLAVESYHMGVGNLQRALRAYGQDDIPYAQLFFDSTPLRHADAWSILAALGDDSSTYLWRVRAAQRIMSLYRDDPKALARAALLEEAAPSAEQVLRPPSTPRFADPGALHTDQLVLLAPAVLAPMGLRLSTALAGRPEGERALQPEALAALRYLGAGARAVSRTAPLTVTAATRDVRTDAVRARGGDEAVPSLRTTGYAFDLSRRYRSGAQAQALQFWLDRLTALDVIAWTRGAYAIHVVAGPRAKDLL
jgi:hypothetical protein